MPITNPKELVAHLEDLCKTYRIEFVGRLPRKDWPENHSETIGTAEVLASYSYDTYAAEFGAGRGEPWKAEVISTAILLQQIAKRCRDRNESSWRHACEPLILRRLLTEVCCTQCRKRTWRSEIEASREEASSTAASLKDRQRARQPCRCPRIFRVQDHSEAAGLNQIFTFRADEVIHHERELSQALGKTESPDRVYGLRLTQNIDNLLYHAAGRKFQQGGYLVERQVFETLGLDQPVDRSGDRLLFPFLILEAKSGKSSSDWHRVRMQSAFSIRTLLRTQARLQNATGRYSKWRSGPLVWFFSSRGEDWRVSIAYTQPVPATANAFGTVAYRVLDVWQGSIETPDGALQLLLLVDFVFDWARDIYRVDILNELRVLASGDNDELSVLSEDADIYSTRYVQPVDRLHNGLTNDTEHTLALETFGPYDTDNGAIRYAGLVESKYCCVLLNRDNLSTFLRLIASRERKRICRRAIRYLQEWAIVVTGQVLNSIEEEWTGKKMSRSTPYHKEMEYFTAISYTTFLSPQWNVTQELFLFAISKDAWQGVIDAAKLTIWEECHQPPAWPNLPVVDITLRTLKTLKGASIAQTLLAAITRTAIGIGICNQRLLKQLSSGGGDEYHEFLEQLRNGDYDSYFFSQTEPKLRRLVHLTYNSVKVGSWELREAFIRFSKRYILKHEGEIETRPNKTWAKMNGELHVSDDGCVLVSATLYPKVLNSSKSICCAYLISRDTFLRGPADVGLVIKRAIESRDFYHTTRNHWVSSRSRIADKEPHIPDVWNLFEHRLYGVLTEGLKFVSYVAQLSGESPAAQGCLTGYLSPGLSIYQRNLNPWQDPLSIITNSESRTFFILKRAFYLFKILLWEASYRRSMAASKRAEGISCCVSCAAVKSDDEDEQCTTCLAENCHPVQWRKQVLLGQEPFTIKAVSNYEIGDRIIALKSSPEKLWSLCHNAFSHESDVASLLNFYAPLEQPAKSIAEVFAQQQDYITYCINAYSDKMYILHKRKCDVKSMDWEFAQKNDKYFAYVDLSDAPHSDSSHTHEDEDEDDESTESEWDL